jgi:hypothetical protein
MGWGEYARSKIPLKLVFILMAAVAVNLMLIESFKLLILFDPADTLNPVGLDSRYAGSTLIDTYVDKDESTPPFENYHTLYLLENPDGERQVAVVENHFLFSRYRYRKNLSLDVPEFASNEVPVFGTNALKSNISCCLAPDGTIESANVRVEPGFPYLLVFLIIAEYLAFIFLFRRDEI